MVLCSIAAPTAQEATYPRWGFVEVKCGTDEEGLKSIWYSDLHSYQATNNLEETEPTERDFTNQAVEALEDTRECAGMVLTPEFFSAPSETNGQRQRREIKRITRETYPHASIRDFTFVYEE
jgi:hypothetical protein